MTHNKGGQVGKFVTGFVSFLLIVFFIAVFIALSSGLAKIKHSADKEAGKDTSFLCKENNLLFKEVEIKIDKQKQQMLLIDALNLFYLDKIEYSDVEDNLKNLVSKDKPCLIIAAGESKNPAGQPGGEARNDFYIEFEEGKAKTANFGAFPMIFSKYRNKDVFRALLINLPTGKEVKKIYIEYYYGQCISGEDENAK